MTDAAPEGTEPEPIEVAVQRLEDRLAATRRQSERALRDLHRRMLRDVRAAERRAERAERRLAESKERVVRLRARARRAEQRVARVTSGAAAEPRAGRLARLSGRLRRRST